MAVLIGSESNNLHSLNVAGADPNPTKFVQVALAALQIPENRLPSFFSPREYYQKQWKRNFVKQWSLAKLLGYQNLKEVFCKWINHKYVDEESRKLNGFASFSDAQLRNFRCAAINIEALSFFLHHVIQFDDDEMLGMLLEMPCMKAAVLRPFVQKGVCDTEFPLTLALKQCAKNPACKTYDILLRKLKEWNYPDSALHHEKDNVLLTILSDESIAKQAPELLLKLINDLPAENVRVLLNLETAIQGDKVMQDFESGSFAMGVDHSQKVKATPIANDYGSKDCVNLSPSIAVSRLNHSESSEPFMPCFSVICYLLRLGYLEVLEQIQKKIPHDFDRIVLLNDYLNIATFCSEREDECAVFIIKYGGLASAIRSSQAAQSAIQFVEQLLKRGKLTVADTKTIISTFANAQINPALHHYAIQLMAILPMEYPPSLGDDAQNLAFEKGLKYLLEALEKQNFKLDHIIKKKYSIILRVLKISRSISFALLNFPSKEMGLQIYRFRWLAATTFENAPSVVNVPDEITKLSAISAQYFLLETLLDFFVQKDFNNSITYSALTEFFQLSNHACNADPEIHDRLQSARQELIKKLNSSFFILQGGIKCHVVVFIIQRLSQEHFAFSVVNTGKGADAINTKKGWFARARVYVNLTFSNLSPKFFSDLNRIALTSLNIEELHNCLDKHLKVENRCPSPFIHRTQKRRNCTSISLLTALEVRMGEETYKKFYRFHLEKNLGFLVQKLTNPSLISDEEWQFLCANFQTTKKDEVIKCLKDWQAVIEQELKGVG